MNPPTPAPKPTPTHPILDQLERMLREVHEGSYETQRKRRWALRDALERIHRNFGLQNLTKIKQKHVDAVVEQWKASDTGHRSIEPKLSHLRWMLRKLGRQKLLPTQNREIGVEPGPRHTKAGKSLPDATFQEFFARARDTRLALTLLAGRYLGLRFKEAALFRPHRDWPGADVIYLKRGTKGGRPRYLWLATSLQREVLERLRRAVPNRDSCLIPPDQTYKQYKERTYKELRELGLGRNMEFEFHDLRRTFACREIDRLIESGRTPDEAAKIVAKSLGHNRTEVLAWYIAGK